MSTTRGKCFSLKCCFPKLALFKLFYVHLPHQKLLLSSLYFIIVIFIFIDAFIAFSFFTWGNLKMKLFRQNEYFIVYLLSNIKFELSSELSTLLVINIFEIISYLYFEKWYPEHYQLNLSWAFFNQKEWAYHQHGQLDFNHDFMHVCLELLLNWIFERLV